VVDILNEDPLEVEGSEPFAGLPPVSESLSVIDIGNHLGNTQKLVAANNSENEVYFRRLFLFFELLPSFSENRFSTGSAGPNVVFDSFVYIIIIATSEDVEMGIRRNFLSIKVRVIDSFQLRENLADRLGIGIVFGSWEITCEWCIRIKEGIIIRTLILIERIVLVRRLLILVYVKSLEITVDGFEVILRHIIWDHFSREFTGHREITVGCWERLELREIHFFECVHFLA
jgi:hypothetical protein